MIPMLVDSKVSSARYETCKSCPNFAKYTGQCLKCGCIMRVKTKLKNQVCPEGRWK